MSTKELRDIIAKLNNAHQDFKHHHKASQEEIKKLGYETSETRNILEKLHDRMDDVETRLNRPRLDVGNVKDAKPAYTKAFDKWFKTGKEDDILHELKQVTFPNMNETIDPDGGYFIPPEYAGFILETLVQHSPIRQDARCIKVNAKDFKIPVQQQAQNLLTGTPQAGLFKTGWTADLGPVNQTDTGKIGMKTIPTNDLYALPFATQDMLDDAAFNIELYIQENLAKSIAYAEGSAFVNGTGVGQPTGLLTFNGQTPFPSQVAPNLPGTLQYSLGESPNVFIDAFYSLPQYYSDRGTWYMNRQTLRIVREWVDGLGQYLWTPNYGTSTAYEGAASILGRPYRECIDFPAPRSFNGSQGIYANNLPGQNGGCVAIFGSMYDAYMVVDRMGIRVLRDPYTEKPFVQFYTTYRVGGTVVLPEALCAINVAANNIT